MEHHKHIISVLHNYIRIISNRITTDKLLNDNLMHCWLNSKNNDANENHNYFQLTLNLEKDILSTSDEVFNSQNFILNNSEWITLKRGLEKEDYKHLSEVVDISNTYNYVSGFIVRITILVDRLQIGIDTTNFYYHLDPDSSKMTIHYIAPTVQLKNKSDRKTFINKVKDKLGGNDSEICKAQNKFFYLYIKENKGRNILIELFSDLNETYKKGNFISVFLSPSIN